MGKHFTGEEIVEMSVDWGVVPAQPEEQGFREWLTSAKLESPDLSGRFPTIAELISVLESFEGLPIQQEAYGESSYSISLGEPHSEQSAYILGTIEDDHFQFHFFGSSNQEITMMEILKRLAGVCGPLILYESIAATPVIIESSTDLEQALKDWRRRSQQRYSEDTHNNMKTWLLGRYPSPPSFELGRLLISTPESPAFETARNSTQRAES